MWSYFNVVGPHGANRLPNNHTLISDSDGDRVIEVDSAGNTLWQYATGLDWPRSVQLLGNDNVLIADSRNNRAIEVNRAGTIIWMVTGVAMPFVRSATCQWQHAGLRGITGE